jgi:hypothetical protein
MLGTTPREAGSQGSGTCYCCSRSDGGGSLLGQSGEAGVSYVCHVSLRC